MWYIYNTHTNKWTEVELEIDPRNSFALALKVNVPGGTLVKVKLIALATELNNL